MKITRQQLTNAASANIISVQQADDLYRFLQTQDPNNARFSFTHVLYYLGGLVAIGAMTLFMNLGWETFGGAGIVFISLLYAAVGLLFSQKFAARNLHIPAAICATFVVCLTPMAIYGIQQWLGIWPDDSVYRDYHRYVQWHWLYMELGTLVVGCTIAWHYKYPFLMMPIAVTLWYMSMDITAMLTGGDYDWELRKLVSMHSGLLMIGLAFWVDIRSRHRADYAFWMYIFGVLAFWGGLSLQHSDSELSRLLYFGINLLMIFTGVLIVRRVFVVLGAIGSCIYLGHLASTVFRDSWLFPISLTAIGLGIIYLGVLWQKYERSIAIRAQQFLPRSVQELLANRN
jgi:energy-converting hydrogenase Eha subunit A